MSNSQESALNERQYFIDRSRYNKLASLFEKDRRGVSIDSVYFMAEFGLKENVRLNLQMLKMQAEMQDLRRRVAQIEVI